jgi:hypothetical protein
MVNHRPYKQMRITVVGKDISKKRKHGNMLKENQPAQSNICLDKYNRGKSTHSHFLNQGATKPNLQG